MTASRGRRGDPGTRAFSLAEVLVALAILVCALLPILTQFLQDHRVTCGNERHVAARRLARRVLDRLSSLDYRTLQSLAGAGADAEGLRSLPSPMSGSEVDAGTTVEVGFEERHADGLARIVVDVTWSAAVSGATPGAVSLRRERLVGRGELTMVQRSLLGEVTP